MSFENQADPTDESPEDVVAAADEVEHDESVSAFRARSNHLLAKPKGLLAAIAIVAALLILVVLWLGPGEPLTAGKRSQRQHRSTAVIEIEIVNPKEGPLGNAELYLKVESSLYPNYPMLYPINVGVHSGALERILRTPFIHQGKTDVTLMMEILDEDGLSSKEEEAIQRIVESGANLIWHTGKLYAAKNGLTLPPAAQEDIITITTLTSGLILESLGQHIFESYGIAEYKSSPNPTINLRDANVLTINYKGNKKPVAKIRVYYPKRVKK